MRCIVNSVAGCALALAFAAPDGAIAAVKSYTVPKQGGSATNTAASMRIPAMPGVVYKTPEGWEKMPAGAMRAASLRIIGDKDQVAEVSAIPLPGFAGSELDNVNRWRSQVGLPEIAEKDLAGIVEKAKISKEDAHLYDISGQKSGSDQKLRVLGAILRREGVVWFFKMTGGEALVGENKGKFLDFLKSVEFTAGEERVMQLPASHPPMGGEASGLPPSHPPIDGAGGQGMGKGDLPPSHPPIGGPGEAKAPAAGSRKWDIPASWKEQAAGSMQMARFSIAGEGAAKAEASVATIGGDGGGALANVNRWRGQIGLGPIEGSALGKETSTFEVGGAKGLMLDATSTDKKRRLIVISVPGQDSTWYYKLMGDEAVVSREKENFIHFVKAAQ